ncbi:MAG TPA: ATP-binding protein, partial [Verrucomicrobiae bacterium]|nr:ATP-binding protein [Verrucomicrobiae bacterium]
WTDDTTAAPMAETATPARQDFLRGESLSHRGTVAALIVLGVALAMAFALVQQRYQRRLLAGYLEVDALVTRRNAELQTAQAELGHSQKMRALGTLAAGIAHDFNNLLSVIRMSNKLVSRAGGGNPEIKENVDEIETAVQQGKTVVNSMLGYSRRDNDSQGPISLLDVVEDGVGLLSKQFLSGLTLKLDLDEDAPPVGGSHGQIEQILLNLLVNAAEAMQRQGELRIAVRRVASLPRQLVLAPRPVGSCVELLVADTGPGIAPEVLPRVFEAFFTTKSPGVGQGTGLGLSTVYTIAENAGYGIAAETSPGKGATFRVFFPAAQGERDSHTDNES